MTERKSLSKKTRFEVFKRDSFTCQYCGKKAPDVILEVDHIKPVKDKGENDMMNLITSCFECNRGKSANKISDNSVVERQRKQIEELNLRRQQLEMMLEWRDGLSSIRNDSYAKVISYWEEKTERGLNQHGISEMQKLIDKFGILNVLDGIDIAVQKYLSDNNVEEVFKKLGGILFLKNAPEYKQKISYIKGICRNKFNYTNEKYMSILLEKFYKDGYDLDNLKEKIKADFFRTWSSLRSFLED